MASYEQKAMIENYLFVCVSRVDMLSLRGCVSTLYHKLFCSNSIVSLDCSTYHLTALCDDVWALVS